jgi:hypothetical protein
MEGKSNKNNIINKPLLTKYLIGMYLKLEYFLHEIKLKQFYFSVKQHRSIPQTKENELHIYMYMNISHTYI